MDNEFKTEEQKHKEKWEKILYFRNMEKEDEERRKRLAEEWVKSPLRGTHCSYCRRQIEKCCKD